MLGIPRRGRRARMGGGGGLVDAGRYMEKGRVEVKITRWEREKEGYVHTCKEKKFVDPVVLDKSPAG